MTTTKPRIVNPYLDYYLSVYGDEPRVPLVTKTAVPSKLSTMEAKPFSHDFTPDRRVHVTPTGVPAPAQAVPAAAAGAVQAAPAAVAADAHGNETHKPLVVTRAPPAIPLKLLGAENHMQCDLAKGLAATSTPEGMYWQGMKAATHEIKRDGASPFTVANRFGPGVMMTDKVTALALASRVAVAYMMVQQGTIFGAGVNRAVEVIAGEFHGGRHAGNHLPLNFTAQWADTEIAAIVTCMFEQFPACLNFANADGSIPAAAYYAMPGGFNRMIVYRDGDVIQGVAVGGNALTLPILARVLQHLSSLYGNDIVVRGFQTAITLTSLYHPPDLDHGRDPPGAAMIGQPCGRIYAIQAGVCGFVPGAAGAADVPFHCDHDFVPPAAAAAVDDQGYRIYTPDRALLDDAAVEAHMRAMPGVPARGDLVFSVIILGDGYNALRITVGNVHFDFAENDLGAVNAGQRGSVRLLVAVLRAHMPVIPHDRPERIVGREHGMRTIYGTLVAGVHYAPRLDHAGVATTLSGLRTVNREDTMAWLEMTRDWDVIGRNYAAQFHSRFFQLVSATRVSSTYSGTGLGTVMINMGDVFFTAFVPSALDPITAPYPAMECLESGCYIPGAGHVNVGVLQGHGFGMGSYQVDETDLSVTVTSHDMYEALEATLRWDVMHRTPNGQNPGDGIELRRTSSGPMCVVHSRTFTVHQACLPGVYMDSAHRDVIANYQIAHTGVSFRGGRAPYVVITTTN